MSPKPSTLLLEMRAAIHASGLSNRAIARLTVNGYPTYDAIRDIRQDDEILPNRGTVDALAQALSRCQKVVEYWKQHQHPCGDACVAYWGALHTEAREARRLAKAENSELPQPPPHYSSLVFASYPHSEYCD